MHLTKEMDMGQLIDCRDEFIMRKRFNKVQRIINEQNLQHRVILVIKEDPDSDTGIGYTLHDKLTNTQRPLDTKIFADA
jgi:hypothetical protein